MFFAGARSAPTPENILGVLSLILWSLLLVVGMKYVVFIMRAMNPWHAIAFFSVNHLHGIVALGSVVLCITGGEALFADMGHFGRSPIQLSWYGLVLPGLLLNYYGQGALLMQRPELIKVNPFYALAPNTLLIPLVALATLASIIASQSMISGVYSLTQQAIQLGFIPRMPIIHTSRQTKGQIYMPTVNWILMTACLSLVLIFRESTRLAAAYGIAVTATMAITSWMYFEVTQIKWKWPLWQSVTILVLFLLLDGAFLGANLLKIVDGGWITIAIAASILTIMTTWRDGRKLLARHYSIMRIPTEVFLKDMAS